MSLDLTAVAAQVITMISGLKDRRAEDANTCNTRWRL